jgi:predicted Zn-dependent protease
MRKHRKPLKNRLITLTAPLLLGAALLAAGFVQSGCQTVEATGERHLALIGEEREIELGRQSDEQIVNTLGLVENEDLQQYVAQLGAEIAATTERPDLPWTFRVVDDSTVNAFALPGGFVYMTRGILAHFENEAQLAGVLGHEIGHITAKHSVIRLSRAQLAQLGFGIATIIEPGLADYAPLAGIGMQLLFLSFSREDELEADELGVRYMANVEENPRELIDVMEMLERTSEAAGGGAVPQWLSTHPSPSNRIGNITSRIRELETEQFATAGREEYLRRIDNMVYGQDPREGYTRNGVFYHPELRFRLDFPGEWQVINQKAAVIGVSPQQNAAIQMTISQESLQESIRNFYDQEAVTGGRARRTTVNGLSAESGPFTARTEQGTLEGMTMFINYQGTVYQIIGYSAQNAWPNFAGQVERTMYSFDELTDPQYIRVQPMRLEIATLNRTGTLEEIHRRYDVSITVEEYARINQAELDTVYEPGDLVKVVTGGEEWMQEGR